MSQIPPDKRYLEAFAWYDYIRPLSKEDVFVWGGKKVAASELDGDSQQARRKDDVQKPVEPAKEASPANEIKTTEEEAAPVEEDAKPVEESASAEEDATPVEESAPEEGSQSEEHEEATPVQS